MIKENKVAFIICVNNSLYYEECVWYINHLHIPDGYEIDTICVAEAGSMTEGYNAAMKESDAKYKVYLHQDVFIYNINFLDHILEIFLADPVIGMIGVLGGRNLPQDAEIWCAWNLGGTYGCDYEMGGYFARFQDKNCKLQEADAIDGMLMATQYDLPWREDLMLGWDFYDVSQSLEFLRKGYKIAIPYQEDFWCMHDCGNSNLSHYDEAREKILKEYSEFFSEPYCPLYQVEHLQRQMKYFELIKKCMEHGMLDEALRIKEEISKKGLNILYNDLQYAINMLDIYSAEKTSNLAEAIFFEGVSIWKDMKDKYDTIKFVVRHAENGTNDQAVEWLIECIEDGSVSREAVRIISERSAVIVSKAVERLLKEKEET